MRRGRVARSPSPALGDRLGARIADALTAACHPRGGWCPSVPLMAGAGVMVMGGAIPLVPASTERGVPATTTTAAAAAAATLAGADVDALVVRLFDEEGRSLVRLARLFVDDRNAAEDLVQEAFIRLARNAHRIEDGSKAVAYLRSIVLNLVRDHNRRGLVSLRHHLPFDDRRASTEDEIVLRADQQEVIEVLRELPHRQRDCLVLRYYQELGIDEIARTLGISRNSVKTHLRRGLGAMGDRMALAGADAGGGGEGARA